MFQREAMGLGVEGGHAVGRHLHRVVAVAGVCDRVHHADVGAVAHHNDLGGPQLAQALIQVRAVESAEACLGDDLVGELLQLRDNLGLLGPADAMGREHLELGVVGRMVVAQEDDGRPAGSLRG